MGFTSVIDRFLKSMTCPSDLEASGKLVICQVGGNWCPWCLRFADFITNNTTISKVINDNFEYIHVNYNPRKSGGEEKEKQADIF